MTTATKIGAMNSPEQSRAMGAWDSGPFHNDDARDFFAELLVNPSALEHTLNPASYIAVYLEAPDGARILAAAEVVAALAGVGHPELPERVLMAVAIYSNRLARLIANAILLLDRVRGENSELRELWEEDNDLFDSWDFQMLELRERLTGKNSVADKVSVKDN